MVDDVNDTCKIFAHICFDVVRLGQKLRQTVVEVGSNDFVNPAFFVVFIEFIKTICKQTVCGADEYTVCVAHYDQLCNIQHTFTGRNHIVDDDNIFAFYGITKEFVSNDWVFTVYNGRVVTTFVEHTHVYTEDVGEVYGS